MEKSCDMDDNNTTSSSHAMPAHRTMFVKLGMSTHYSSSRNIDKRYKSISTCHYCGIIGQTYPNCFKKCSQKPWDKKHVLKENEPGIRNQINNLCDQVKLISEKLENPTLFNKNSVMAKKEKDVSKYMWVKKSDNLCLVANTTLKVLDTCLWYLDRVLAPNILKNKWTSNLTVCVNSVQQNIKCRIKGDKYFVDEVETQLREKPLRGSQTQDIHYSEDKTRYKVVTLTYL
jgi:hypothetical protein